MTPEQDAAHAQAVESGDMETAQAMVDEAAKKAGYDVKGYHGTRSPVEFTEFEPNEALGGAIFVAVDPADAHIFYQPNYNRDIHDVKLLAGVVQAVERIKSAIQKKQLILALNCLTAI